MLVELGSLRPLGASSEPVKAGVRLAVLIEQARDSTVIIREETVRT